MFEFFRRLPIKSKLILVIFNASMFVTLISFLFFMVLNAQSIREEAVERTQSEMNVMSQDFVKIVMFSDTYLAADVVTKLRLLKIIKNVFLYDSSGKRVFRYEDSPSSIMEPPDFMSGKVRTGVVFTDDFFQIIMPMRYAGGEYGWIFSRVSTEQLDKKLQEHYRLIAIAIPIMLLMSYLLAVWLQRYFSEPIISLSERLSRIAENQDFSAQVTSDETHEIGSLYRSTGKLLDAIQLSQRHQQQSEARLGAIIGIVGSALVSIDEDHRITLFNHQAEYVFGYPAHEVMGQSLNILLPSRFQEKHFQHVQNFSEQNVQVRVAIERQDVWGIRKNGEEFPVEASISQLVLEGKKIFTVALTDVSQRRRTEEELEAYRSHLEDVVAERTSELRTKNSELEAFSYTVAHDLRAPLRSITSFSQILIEDAASKLNKEELDSLTRIVQSGKRMSELIDGILNLARIGRAELSASEVDLSTIVTQVKARLEHELPDRAVQWKIAPGVFARGDRQLLGMVIENLMGNAWKYTSRKKQALIEFGVTEKRGKQIFFVRDNGAGFNMKYAENLFNVFQRLHSVEDYEGTGVGLATVQRIIHRHGGSIWAEAVVNEGATFYFTLPA